MKKIADIVDFRRDLFFDGAVQIGWFETDSARRDLAASHFVFHDPQHASSLPFALAITRTITDGY
ncbi:MAG: hypothetical protein GY801_51085 [bacterium]|nr:hypothetical protein [bacterium]